MSGLFGSTTIPGNRLVDFAETTATIGIPLPYGYGTAPFDGNVIFAALPPKEHVTKKRQGKGGTKTETYTYTLSYAVGFCSGPIYGFMWIKRNGKIVYTQDPNAPAEDKLFAAKWRQRAQFYYGTEDQLPDSTIESYEGSGQVSAFRGIAYIVVEDDDVTDGSGAVPTYEACCICTPPDVYLTSRPFPSDMAPEGLDLNLDLGEGELRPLLFEKSYVEAVDLAFDLGAGELKTPIIPYYNPPESVDVGIQLGTARLYDPIRPYAIPAESADTGITLGTGWLRLALVNYERYPPESIDVGMNLGAGTLGP
ncbi:minor tail protein [Stenotrophomonas phage Sonora]|nr:minor tail protein [Stenotrophomonas phage Sonora]